MRPNLNIIWTCQSGHLPTSAFMRFQDVILSWLHIRIAHPFFNRDKTFHFHLQKELRKSPPNKHKKDLAVGLQRMFVRPTPARHTKHRHAIKKGEASISANPAFA
jgi:hypothetical protein